MITPVQLTAILEKPELYPYVVLTIGLTLYSFFKLSEVIYQTLIVWWAIERVRALVKRHQGNIPSPILRTVYTSPSKFREILKESGSRGVLRRLDLISLLVSKYSKKPRI